MAVNNGKKLCKELLSYCMALVLFLFMTNCLASETSFKSVKLALIISETGKAKIYSRPVLEGAMIALHEINMNGGLLDIPLEMIVIDNHSTPIGAQIAAKKAVAENVHGVIGSVWSSHSVPVAKIMQKAKIPMISPVSTKPSITRVGNYIFRSCFTDSFQGRILADFAYNDIKARSGAVMVNISEDYSITLSQFFIEYFTMMGGKIPYKCYYKNKAIDFSHCLINIQSLVPDIIFIPGYYLDSGLIIKQSIKMGIKTRFIGGDGWEGPIYRYAKNGLEGSYFSTHWTSSFQSCQSRKFQNMYKAEFGYKTITPFAPLAYDAVMIFAEGVKRAGSVNREKIRDAIAKTENFKGATGTITFNEYGDPIAKPVNIMKFERGRWRFLKRMNP